MYSTKSYCELKLLFNLKLLSLFRTPVNTSYEQNKQN